jgi:RNA polymerase sigma-70 factor (ECF subfamily)
VERLRRQEEGAAEALLAAYGNRVYRLAIRITGNSSDAEEVVQDALWAATRKIDTFLGTAAFGSWIYRITANAACQKRRRRHVERAEVAWDDLGPSFDELGQHVQPGIDWSPRLKDPALQAELRTVLGAAIEALPEEYRAVLLLHDVEGFSSPEISEALQIKLGHDQVAGTPSPALSAEPPGAHLAYGPSASAPHAAHVQKYASRLIGRC